MTGIDRIPLAHSVCYVAHGLPEVPNHYGPGVLAPSEITLTYRAAPDSQLGRVHAYVAGRLWVDGKEVPLQPGGLYGQHYLDGLDNWPEWLAEEARLHDPEAAAVSAAVAPPTDPTHGLSVPHADALWDAVAIPGPHTPTYPEQHERVCRVVRDILDELTPARDDAVAQTALRDRIADKLTAAAYECDGKCGLSERECYDAHPITFSAMAGGTTHVDGSVTAIADAVLAALPSAADWDALVREADRLRRDGAALHARAEEIDTQLAALRQQVVEPADRAAVLADVERAIRAATRSCGYKAEDGCDFCNGVAAALDQVRRMADETATKTPDAVDLPTLAAALDGLHTLIATSSRDWQTYRVDAWLWAVLCGWDCEQTEHDETCVHGALEETAAMHGWDEATVAKARRYRAAVRAVTEQQPAAGARQDGAET
jgi:hypothetical protein